MLVIIPYYSVANEESNVSHCKNYDQRGQSSPPSNYQHNAAHQLGAFAEISHKCLVFESIPAGILIHFYFVKNFPAMIGHKNSQNQSHYKQAAIIPDRLR